MSELRGSAHNWPTDKCILFAFVVLAQIHQNYFFAWWPSFPVQEMLPHCFIRCFMLNICN